MLPMLARYWGSVINQNGTLFHCTFKMHLFPTSLVSNFHQTHFANLHLMIWHFHSPIMACFGRWYCGCTISNILWFVSDAATMMPNTGSSCCLSNKVSYFFNTSPVYLPNKLTNLFLQIIIDNHSRIYFEN